MSKARTAVSGLVASEEELAAFRAEFAPGPFVPPLVARGSDRARLRRHRRRDRRPPRASSSPRTAMCSATAYRLSRGNPIEDTVDIIGRAAAPDRGSRRVARGARRGHHRATRRALLRDVFRADVAIVETVAHAAGRAPLLRRPPRRGATSAGRTSRSSSSRTAGSSTSSSTRSARPATATSCRPPPSASA